jgi:hypothetical protein
MNRSLCWIVFSFFFAAAALSQTRSEKYQLLLQAANISGDLDPHGKCGFPTFAALYQASLRNSAIALLFKAVFQRPVLPNSYVTPDGRFRFHYTTARNDSDAVNPTSTIVAGVPDYIYEAGVAAQKAYRLLRDVLGFDLPLPDGSEGGGSEYDFYVINENRDYGHTEWNAIDASGRGPAYSFVDNNFVGYATTGLAALRVTVAHEYFHGVQLAYRYRDEDRFFLEMSSVWFEDYSYDEVNDYYFYLRAFFNNPDRSLHETAGYESCIWLHYLTKRTRTSRIVLDLWKEVKLEPAIRAFKTVLENSPYHIEFSEAFNEFNTWCYFTGPAADSARYFEEGAKYPQLKFKNTITTSRDTTISGGLDAVAANFYRVIRNPQNFQALLPNAPSNLLLLNAIYKNNQQQYRLSSSAGRTPVDVPIPSSVKEDTFVVSVVNTNLPSNFSNYRLQLRPVEKLQLTIVLEKPRPNPFNPSRGRGKLFFPFRINLRAPLDAAIIREDGKVMKRYDLGELPADIYSEAVSWDGHDESGNRAASGVYFLRLWSGDIHEFAKFVLIN